MIVHDTRDARITCFPANALKHLYCADVKLRQEGEPGWQLCHIGSFPTQDLAQRAINERLYPHLIKGALHT